MTKTFVQLYVENLLKLLKVLKTRTALIMNGLSELRMSYARKGAKAPIKTRKCRKDPIGKKLQRKFKNLLDLKN